MPRLQSEALETDQEGAIEGHGLIPRFQEQGCGICCYDVEGIRIVS
jgi:hypothetical protein